MITMEINATGFSILMDGKPILSHRSDAPFMYAGRGSELVEMYRGNFEIEDRIAERVGLSDWEFHDPTAGNQGAGAPGTGSLGTGSPETGSPESGGSRSTVSRTARIGAAGLQLVFSASGKYRIHCVLTEEEGRLVLRFKGYDTTAGNRFWFRLPAQADERVYGGGEQFSHFNLRGRRFPLWSSEQGVGRNKRTRITFEADVNDRCGGDYWWTFFPQPTMVSSRHYYVHADCPAYAAFDFRDPSFHELEFWALPDSLTFGSAPSMLALVQDVSALLGRQPPLPDWVHDGVILRIQGGTEICQSKLERARERGVPVSGIWAQDWEGIRMTSFGQRLMWNWEWDPERYPGLPEAIRRWKKDGVRFMGYANPYVAAGKPLFKEAAAQGFLAKDASGKDYLVDFGEFDAGIPDFTNPAAYDWYKAVIRRNLVDFGLAGWMADFGEYLPTDAVLYDGRPAMLAHNEWPAIWARINQEAVAETGLMDEVTFFMRAGFTGSQKWCPLMWAGDQNVDWSEDDGIGSVIPAALSLAMCGHGLHHSDIGGYTTLYGMERTKELFLRWTEFAAFTPMMRSHEGNRPKDNWQFDSDDATLDGLASMGRVFVALKAYRTAVVDECARKGVPAMRPLFLHYEDDPASWTLKDQYLFGPDLLVAPVVQEGATSRMVHFPSDGWVHFWMGDSYKAGDHHVDAPVGMPPVFYRAGSSWVPVFALAATARA